MIQISLTKKKVSVIQVYIFWSLKLAPPERSLSLKKPSFTLNAIAVKHPGLFWDAFAGENIAYLAQFSPSQQ